MAVMNGLIGSRCYVVVVKRTSAYGAFSSRVNPGALSALANCATLDSKPIFPHSYFCVVGRMGNTGTGMVVGNKSAGRRALLVAKSECQQRPMNVHLHPWKTNGPSCEQSLVALPVQTPCRNLEYLERQTARKVCWTEAGQRLGERESNLYLTATSQGVAKTPGVSMYKHQYIKSMRKKCDVGT